MRVLIGCEYSGVVRDAFIRLGHDAMSCDLLPTEKPGPHYQGDVFDVIDYPWDLGIFHFPCTNTAVSGAAWFEEKRMDGRQQASVSLFMRGWRRAAHIPKVAFEQPVSIISSLFRKPDQFIQPWQYGHAETKKTALWLRGLPALYPTNRIEPEFIIGKDGSKYSPVHYCSQWKNGEERWKIRSRTYPGIARAMAEQWGGNILKQQVA